MSELEPDAENLLKSGKKLCDQMSDIPPLYSIAISLKRIADNLDKFAQVPKSFAPEEDYDISIPPFIIRK